MFRLAAVGVFAMFFVVLLFFREPQATAGRSSTRAHHLPHHLRNFLTVVSESAIYAWFLLIFTGYWIVFWQQYIILPGYIHTYINADASVEKILVTDGAP